MNGHCKMCGRCCRVSVVTVPASDWDASLEEFLILKGKHYLDTIDNQRRYVYWAPCPHLDLITDKCGIHERKPAACKRYPDDQMTLLPGCGYTKEEKARSMTPVRLDIGIGGLDEWYCPFCDTLNSVRQELEPCIGCKATPHFVAEGAKS